MSSVKPVWACDCETDPFIFGRVPVPFAWGLYSGKDYYTFTSTEEFVRFVEKKRIILYAHNGGKFDFMFLLPYLGATKVQIIAGRMVSMMLGKCELRDSYSIIPAPLKDFGTKKDIAIWKLEKHHRDKFMPEILDYLFWDCKTLWTAVTQYRLIAGTNKTIASNAMAFSKRLGIDPGKTNHRFDEKYRPFYFGGRCECPRPGSFRDIQIIDIRSAYPYAMLTDHPTGDKYMRATSLDGLSIEQIKRAFITVECTSHGAFPLRDSRPGKWGLIFPHEYNEFYVTGWEYLTAKEFGLIENEKIIEVRHTNDRINFSGYIDHWFKHKAKSNKKTDPINYEIGKRMMNSLYGKLGQNPARYYDYVIHPAGTKIDMENGWMIFTEYDNHEIHRRSSLWRYKFNYGADWVSKGIYNNVATGASITGFTRAHLLRAMHTVGIEHVIYCDTDSIICTKDGKIDRLPMSEAIGDWEHEDTSPIGYFNGKKLYGIKLSDRHDKAGVPQYKIASKGSRLNQEMVTEELDGLETTWVKTDDKAAFDKMVRLAAGETVIWDNPAPSFKIDGSAEFVRRKIRATAKLPSQPT